MMPVMVPHTAEPNSNQLPDEALLRATLDLIPAYAWYAALSGVLTFVNERTASYLGLPNDHPLRLGVPTDAAWDSHIALLHPGDHDETRRVWSTCLRTGCAGEVRFRVRAANGAYRWFLSRAEPVRGGNGTLLYWVGVNLDIDDAMRAEHSLRESEKELHDVIDTIPAIVWSALPDGSNAFVNKRFVEYSGISEKDSAGSGWQAATHPDDLDQHAGKWFEAVAAGTPHENEVRFRRSDGQYRWHLDRAVPLRDTDGQIVKWYGVLTDIEDRKHAEEALRRSESYLSEAQALSHMGSWVWRVPGKEAIHLSDEWYRIYGFDPTQGTPTWNERLQRIHPEDRNKWRQTLEAAIGQRSDYEIKFRILLPDGTVRWLHSIGHPVFSSTGELVQFVGSSMDITVSKRAEEKLREQDLELRQMLEFAPQLVAVFGPQRERVYINQIALDYLGMSLEEWRQQPVGAEVHPDDSEQIREYAERAKSDGSPYELEVRLRKADGSYRWFLARYNPVKGDRGEIFRWYVACTDIDDRKRAEEKLRQENAALREELDQASMFEEIVGTSSALQSVLSRLSKVAPSDSTVLITGETGTGKELIARAIHRRSTRASRPFITVNCAAIPRDLIASELFGHEKGAFTGALQRQIGRFELADRGTIFLDEVGELLPDTQVALLRVLQEREFERVGGRQPISIDVRIIAATNRDLEATVASGAFRQDLFYRLNVFPIVMPSLRERKDDILMLVEYFVQRYASRAGKHFASIDQETVKLLCSYDWPGNIRELQNVIERSVILSSGGVLSIDESWISRERVARAHRTRSSSPKKVEEEPYSERAIIEGALTASRGRVSGPLGAAARLRIPPSTLDHKIKALGIDKRQFRYSEAAP
jgi:PAS domain S-box-containing protein